MQERPRHHQLWAALTRMPVMATEMRIHDMRLCAVWLKAGATDVIRVHVRNGTRSLINLARSDEMNAVGGVDGHVHVQLQGAIANSNANELVAGAAACARDWHHKRAGRRRCPPHAVDAAQ